MSDETTPRLALPCLAAGQAQKEITHNEALQRLDALVQPVVLSADLAMPPDSPAPGACWIVAAGASGAWAGHTGAVAQWTAGGWRFLTPAAGWQVRVVDRDAVMIHDDSGWMDGAVRADGFYVAGEKIIGSRMADIAAPVGGATTDDQARMAIGQLLAALRGHGLIG